MLDILIIIATFCQKSTEGSDCMRQHWFVCLGFFVPLENFLLIWRRHHYRWRTASSALLAIEQWGLFSVQHLQWYMASVYNGHLRGHVTLTPIAERLAVELSCELGLSRRGFKHPTFCLRGERSNSLRHRCGCQINYFCRLLDRKHVLPQELHLIPYQHQTFVNWLVSPHPRARPHPSLHTFGAMI